MWRDRGVCPGAPGQRPVSPTGEAACPGVTREGRRQRPWALEDAPSRMTWGHIAGWRAAARLCSHTAAQEAGAGGLETPVLGWPAPWPGLGSSERPTGRSGRGDSELWGLGRRPRPARRPLTLGWIWMVAMSDFLSMSLMVASYVSPFCSCTLSCCRPETALEVDTTWALVTIRPASDMMKPEPLDRGTLRPNRGCLRGASAGRGGVVRAGGGLLEGSGAPCGVRERGSGPPTPTPPSGPALPPSAAALAGSLNAGPSSRPQGGSGDL